MRNRVLLAAAILLISVLGLWRWQVTGRMLPVIVSVFAASVAMPMLAGVARDYL